MDDELVKTVLMNCNGKYQNSNCVKLSGKISKEDKEKLIRFVGKKLFEELSEIVDKVNSSE